MPDHDSQAIALRIRNRHPGRALRLDRCRSSNPISDRSVHFYFGCPLQHFTNPNGKHDINDINKFENLLVDRLADGTSVDAPTTIEQRALETFIAHTPNVTAYFHGNSNWNQFYDWTGPDGSVVLHTFRVDSPMKGASSSRDEGKLSFQVVTIDTTKRLMTVRECLWNADPTRPLARVGWGASTNVALNPRPSGTVSTKVTTGTRERREAGPE